MTTMSPFGSVAPEPEAPVDTASAGAGSSLNPVVIGAAAVGGAALLGAAAWFFLLSGAEEPTLPLAAPAPVTSPAPSGPAEPSAGESLPVLPPVVNQEVRDPLKALIVAPVAAAGDGDGPAGAAPLPAPVSSSTPTPTDTALPAGLKPTPTTGPVLVPTMEPVVRPLPTTTPQPTSYVLVLDDVSEDNSSARLDINGTEYTPKLGESFGPVFRLNMLLDGECALVQIADSGVSLCEGETLTARLG